MESRGGAEPTRDERKMQHRQTTDGKHVTKLGQGQCSESSQSDSVTNSIRQPAMGWV